MYPLMAMMSLFPATPDITHRVWLELVLFLRLSMLILISVIRGLCPPTIPFPNPLPPGTASVPDIPLALMFYSSPLKSLLLIMILMVLMLLILMLIILLILLMPLVFFPYLVHLGSINLQPAIVLVYVLSLPTWRLSLALRGLRPLKILPKICPK